ncbi:MAG TPA: HD domain-containing protein [Acidimicrobiia bacterium]|nr:HD domain-containing protein [Acidimicrobiia bacterium]
MERAQAAFTGMEESTAEDWAIIGRNFVAHGKGLADRILAHLELLDGDFGGFQVDRLTHSLQTATRAFRAGEDEEYVVCALLHDIGDTLGSYNHADIAAAIVRPFVSEENHWMVEKHAIFQGYFFFHHLGMDRNLREQFRGHPAFERTARFCELYDSPAFDPAGETLPLEHFAPMVRRLFEVPRQTLYSGIIAAAEAPAHS